MRLALVVFSAFVLAGCAGPGHVQYDGGRCLRDGRPLSAAEVEADQAQVARRLASRQPWFAVITIGIVLLAAAGNAEKALLLVRARHLEGPRPLAERLRDVLVGQRDKPVRFAAIVGGSLGLIAIAGVAYVYLDIDKRASERALGMLQFCHLALRTQEEEGVLDEQKHNLQDIESTAGDIRALVGKLPPDEKRKAQLIVDQMNTALAKQGRIVGEYATRTDEAAKNLSAHTVAMEKGIASVEEELAELRTLPASLKDLEGAAHHIDATTTAFDARFAELHARVAELEDKVDLLLARPAYVPPSPGASKASPVEAPSPASSVAAAPNAHATTVAPTPLPAKGDAGAAVH